MLTALLVLEAVLKPIARSNTQRRGTGSEWIVSTGKPYRKTRSPLLVKKKLTLFSLQPLSSNNIRVMSTGYQSPASVAPSAAAAENSDGVLNNNTAVM